MYALGLGFTFPPARTGEGATRAVVVSIQRFSPTPKGTVSSSSRTTWISACFSRPGKHAAQVSFRFEVRTLPSALGDILPRVIAVAGSHLEAGARVTIERAQERIRMLPI